MLEQALDADQRLKLDETVEAINEGTRVLNEFCTSIRYVNSTVALCWSCNCVFRDSIVSRDSDIRRKALDELSYVVLHLDESTLIDAEGEKCNNAVSLIYLRFQPYIYLTFLYSDWQIVHTHLSFLFRPFIDWFVSWS